MMQEAVIASRSFVNEGEFHPKVVGSAAPVRGLTESPPLLGFLATTTKPAARTALVVGDDEDPLLASWQVGLGRATAWTSDASARWSRHWVGWPGYSPFWTTLVKDTFAPSGSGGAGARATVEGDRLRVVAESEAPWPDGAVATARVVAPDLSTRQVQLERSSGTTFAVEVPATRSGTYAVGVSVTSPSGASLSASALASQSYSPEYRPGPSEPHALERVSALSGGRGAIEAAAAFDPDGLPAGRGRVPLAGWFVVLAALLWPIDVALRRLSLHGTGVTALRTGAGRVGAVVRWALPRGPGREPRPRSGPESDRGAPGPGRSPGKPPPETLGRLLDRKRGGSQG